MSETLSNEMQSPAEEGIAIEPFLADPYVEAPDTLNDLMWLLGSWDSEGNCVWRGQSNFLWSPVPSLYRRLRYGGLSDEQISEGALTMVEQDMINKARIAGFPVKSYADILSFMVDMQHYGGATRFLDVTRSFRIALFFACQSKSRATGVVIRYKVSESRTLSQGDGATWRDIVACEPGRPVLLEPDEDSNPRVKAQGGAFITTVLKGSLAEPNLFSRQTAESRSDLILVRPELKGPVLDLLAAAGVSERKLFPPTIELFAPRFGVRETPRFLE